MIVVNFDLQCVGCNVCDEQTEVPARKFYDQEHMMLLRECLADEHKECTELAHNPRQAKAVRAMRREIRKLRPAA